MDYLIEALVFCFLAQLMTQSLEFRRLLAFGQLGVSDFHSAFDGPTTQPAALKKGL
jgi:hypothetical protein